MIKARLIDYVPNSNLVEIKRDTRVAVFENPQTKHKQEVKFELAHIVPPMRTSEFIRSNTELSDANGFVDVNPFTLQHKRFNNVWALGDCANLPTTKTTAAIMSQTPVLVSNIAHILSGKGLLVPH